jgi:hypothetical protein
MKHMLDKLSGQDDEQDGDAHAHAKMQVLHELRNMAMDMMGDKVKGKLPHDMHGVEVMAPDAEGLHKGLDLAQKVLPDEESSGHGQPDSSHALSPEADLSEERLENPGEDEDEMSDDELDSMIAELQAKKASRDPRFQK